LYSKYSFLSPVKNEFEKAKVLYDKMLSQQSSWKSYIPKIIWYGSKNQYHFWLFGDGKQRKGVVRGDFGYSYIDSQPINTKIWSKVWISFSFSLLSVIFAYIISIPLGIYSAYKKDTKFDRITSIVVFVLYSMPGFFIGVLLLYTFANPDTLRWFPVSGIQDPTLYDPSWSMLEKIQHRVPYFILPLITYTYSSFAFLSRIMRVGVIDVFGQDYIRTARAKGLGEGKVVMKHALRNSLLPIITVFANIFPLAIGGSVIIETIFTIPGMGFEIYSSILNSDYPMIVAVFTIIGFLTMIGYLVADILYAVVDPRISYK
jgi:ABC-type dipeptide/oligopeptide/nickel transport system permease component